MRFPMKSYLSKLSFEVGKNPKVEKIANAKNLIPKPYKSVLMISADFELAWAFRYTKTQKDPVANALEKARLARKNFPGLIQLCDKYNVPITWATVGHLFLDSCVKDNGVPHKHLERLNHFESPYWKFDNGDWFKDDPCSNIKEDPEWYATDLIDMIINSKVNHEIGSHTFSHIDCRESVCTPEVFKLELEECKKMASTKNIDLKSFVFPGHTIGNIDHLAELGFTSYRSNFVNTLGYPVQRPDKLWEHKSTVEFDIRPNWSMKYHVYRYKKIVDRAIKNGTNCHFWFHPSMPHQFLTDIMPALFEHIDKRRDEIWPTTMGEYTNWLNQNHSI